MEYSTEFSIYTFEFWAGAKDRVKNLTYDQLDQLGDWIEETFSCDPVPPTETEINDLVWFESDEFFEELEQNDDDEDMEETD